MLIFSSYSRWYDKMIEKKWKMKLFLNISFSICWCSEIHLTCSWWPDFQVWIWILYEQLNPFQMIPKSFKWPKKYRFLWKRYLFAHFWSNNFAINETVILGQHRHCNSLRPMVRCSSDIQIIYLDWLIDTCGFPRMIASAIFISEKLHKIIFNGLDFALH